MKPDIICLLLTDNNTVKFSQSSGPHTKYAPNETLYRNINLIYLGTERAPQLDEPLFYKTLFTNDEIVLTGNYFLYCANLSNSGLHLERGMLLEKKRTLH